MDLLELFKNAQNHPDSMILQDIQHYIEWLISKGNNGSTPKSFSNGALRTYLLEHQSMGMEQNNLFRILCSLEQFYTWLKTENRITENPFETFNFKQLLRPSDQIHHRQDTFLGTPEEREIARLRALNHLADLTNQLPDAESIIQKTLETLLGVMSLDTAWVFVLAEMGLFTNKKSSASPEHDFILADARDLPESLEVNQHHLPDPLTELPLPAAAAVWPAQEPRQYRRMQPFAERRQSRGRQQRLDVPRQRADLRW